MTRCYDISTQGGINLAVDELLRDFKNSKFPRVHIHLEGFDSKCRSCGKELSVGEEKKYGTDTRCRACKKEDEDFDDEMS